MEREGERERERKREREINFFCVGKLWIKWMREWQNFIVNKIEEESK